MNGEERTALIVSALADQVKRLTDTLEDVKPKAEQAVPRNLFQRTLALVVLVAALALAAEHVAIRSCFLSPPDANTAGRVACGVLFPGYGSARAEGDRNLAKFGELLSEVPRNKARVAQLEREVARLKARR